MNIICCCSKRNWIGPKKVLIWSTQNYNNQQESTWSPIDLLRSFRYKKSPVVTSKRKLTFYTMYQIVVSFECRHSSDEDEGTLCKPPPILIPPPRNRIPIPRPDSTIPAPSQGNTKTKKDKGSSSHRKRIDLAPGANCSRILGSMTGK